MWPAIRELIEQFDEAVIVLNENGEITVFNQAAGKNSAVGALRIPAQSTEIPIAFSIPQLDGASSGLPVILAIRSMERYLYISPAYERIYGQEPSALFVAAGAALDRVHPEDREMMRVRLEADRSGAAQEYEFRVLNHFGDYRRLRVKVHPFVESASGELLVASLTEDITDLVLPPVASKSAGPAGAKGVSVAEFRQGLSNCVDEWCSSETAPFFAIAFVDLVRFHAVNDSFGYSEGDKLLEEVQRRISAVLPTEDRVAGFGSDRFALLLRSVGEPGNVEELMRSILAALAVPFTLGTNQVSLPARAGLAYPRGMDCTVDMLLRNADSALQLAKQRREGLVVSKMSRGWKSMEQASLEFDLTSALDLDEFFFEFQPVFEPGTGKVELLEALVRWRHPRLGVVSPASFISLAEDSGLVLRLDMQGLERLERQLEYWRLLQPGIRAVPVSINISGRHFPSFVMEEQFHTLLKQPAIQASKIIFEITESVFVDTNHRTAAGLGRLRDAGVKIWLDDFGEGYSSFQYLSHFPVDGIKISESFVKNCVREEKSRVILKTLKSLALDLGMEIVVEGIENQEQLDLLQNMGFALVQGYYLSRPLAAGEIPDLLRKA